MTHLLKTLFLPPTLQLGVPHTPPHSQTEEKLLVNARNDRRNGQRENGGSKEDMDRFQEAAQPHGCPGQQEDREAQEPLWTQEIPNYCV